MSGVAAGAKGEKKDVSAGIGQRAVLQRPAKMPMAAPISKIVVSKPALLIVFDTIAILSILMPQDSLFKPVRWSRHKSGDIIVTFDLVGSGKTLLSVLRLPQVAVQLIKWVVLMVWRVIWHGVQAVDRLAAHRLRWVVTAGLGIGFGMGLVVAGAPSQLVAAPDAAVVQKVSETAVVPATITLTNLDTFDHLERRDAVQVVAQSVTDLQQVWFWLGAKLSQPGIVVVGGINHNRLQQVELGQKVVVIGSNQGEYHYQVTGIKTMAVDQVAGMLKDQVSRPTLLLTTLPALPWEKEVLVLTAIAPEN